LITAWTAQKTIKFKIHTFITSNDGVGDTQTHIQQGDLISLTKIKVDKKTDGQARTDIKTDSKVMS
jgi:hypothetical protein